MKNTQNMLVFLATLTITTMVIALLTYILCDDITYRECFYQNAFLGFMVFFGWVPAFIVTCDYSDYQEKKELNL